MKTTLALSLLGLAAVSSAQVSSINSARNYRGFFDDSESGFSATNSYPSSIVFSETNVDGDGSGTFANRANWDFSNNAGSTSYAFNNDDFFSTFMDVTISLPQGSLITPRKEAGYLLQSAGGEGHFIVNTDAHEIVAFGGPFPFFRFDTPTVNYDAGETIRLGITYFLDPTDNLRKIIYSADGVNSPAQAVTNLEQGIITGSTLGGYSQTNISSANPANGATYTFGNVSLNPVPEPATMAALGLGALGLLRRRRSSK